MQFTITLTANDLAFIMTMCDGWPTSLDGRMRIQAYLKEQMRKAIADAKYLLGDD